MTRTFCILAAVFVPMLLEARRSGRNTAALRARGAVEPPGDVYRQMQAAYPLSFLAMIAEGAVRARRRPPRPAGGALLFIAAKALKYWAIATLGPRWSFRVLVPPGEPPVVRGPYRMLRHPNYVAVAGELAGTAMMAGAPVTGAIATIGFGALMLARVRVEDRALER